MSSDLFWAFQPKRVMLPSLPLRLGTPAIPNCGLADEARLARMVFSEMFSINPPPRTGVGMRRLRLPLAASAAKSGCARLQVFGVEGDVVKSVRPAIVNRSCTPLSDLKRASRTGPSAVTKNGIELLPLATWPTVNCGFCLNAGPTSARGEVPPVAGCEWQEPQESLLNVGPRPPLPGPPDKLTGSVSINCDNPFVKAAVCPSVRPWIGFPGLVTGRRPGRGPGSRLARLAARFVSRSKSWAMTPAAARQMERTRNTDT